MDWFQNSICQFLLPFLDNLKLVASKILASENDSQHICANSLNSSDHPNIICTGIANHELNLQNVTSFYANKYHRPLANLKIKRCEWTQEFNWIVWQ